MNGIKYFERFHNINDLYKSGFKNTFCGSIIQRLPIQPMMNGSYFKLAVTLRNQIIFIQTCMPRRAIKNHLHYDKCAIYNLCLLWAVRIKYQFRLQIGGFQRECFVYNDLMKKFQNIRKRVALPELKIPKVLLTNEDDGILIMENLKTKGFQLLDRVHNEGKYWCFH